MRFEEPPPEETALQPVALEPPLRQRPRLNWTDHEGLHSIQIEKTTVIGSATNAGIVLQDPTVSRLHAELEVRADGLWLRDLGSRNGTFAQGMRVTACQLPHGGRFRVGSVEFRVDYESADKVPVEVWPADSFGPLVGGSVAMRELFATLARVAPMDSSVLIHGETGTGKELIARAIHDASTRATKPFIVVDCAALPDNLLDAELFGHTKGAFTGASGARTGAIESADGGTVFLDEIGELPIAMQPKLLRVLESRTVRRVGESNYRQVNVRFISATHRDLPTMVNAGDFREDLYFRLAVLPLTVPPLRERKEDIERLVNVFWAASGGAGSVSPDFMREIADRPWRGNVRELRNFVERARALGPGAALALSRGPAPGVVHFKPDDPAVFQRTYKDFRESWHDTGEREYIRRLLQRHDRNVAAAAREAEVDRTYIYRLIRKHDL